MSVAVETSGEMEFDPNDYDEEYLVWKVGSCVYTCEICALAFVDGNAAVGHLLREHGLMEEEYESVFGQLMSTWRKKRCAICRHRVYDNQRDRRAHLNLCHDGMTLWEYYRTFVVRSRPPRRRGVVEP